MGCRLAVTPLIKEHCLMIVLKLVWPLLDIKQVVTYFSPDIEYSVLLDVLNIFNINHDAASLSFETVVRLIVNRHVCYPIKCLLPVYKVRGKVMVCLSTRECWYPWSLASGPFQGLGRGTSVSGLGPFPMVRGMGCPSLWSLVLSGRGSVSGPWSCPGERVRIPGPGQGYSLPLPLDRTMAEYLPGQNQDRVTPRPHWTGPPDMTHHGQDMPRSVRFFRSRRRTRTSWFIMLIFTLLKSTIWCANVFFCIKCMKKLKQSNMTVWLCWNVAPEIICHGTAVEAARRTCGRIKLAICKWQLKAVLFRTGH